MNLGLLYSEKLLVEVTCNLSCLMCILGEPASDFHGGPILYCGCRKTPSFHREEWSLSLCVRSSSLSCAEKVNESTYMTTWTNSTVKFIKTESRIVVSRDEEEKGMES